MCALGVASRFPSAGPRAKEIYEEACVFSPYVVSGLQALA